MMYYPLYYFFIFSALLLGIPFFLVRMATTRRFRVGLGERFGFYRSGLLPRGEGGAIWVQAASVGEVNAALPLIGLLREEYPSIPVVLACQTAAGRSTAVKKLGGQAAAILSPLDLGPVVGRLIRRISPRILILIETEIWPGTILAARRRGIPVVVVNGRISDRSFPRYRRARIFLQPVLSRIDGFGMRSELDAGRIRVLGAPPGRVRVTGNIKFDSLDLSRSPSGGGRESWGWPPDAPVIVAGSTYEGEEELLLKAFQQLRGDFPGLKLILAPRHLERIGAVEDLLRARGEDYRLFSRISSADGETGLVILDRMGVLSALYREASVVFVGRSLRGSGGQNPIEPAAAARPIIFGPRMENFAEIAEELVLSGGAIRIDDENRLPAVIGKVLAHPGQAAKMGTRARAAVEKRRGASRRNLEMIGEIIK
ncbi:MAG: 3-deoxy-D-manno-octulosonic acid transferase [Candidatus Erginobacter occultus]|nr:3-deoxy-D-manno-octulosonic acid transferase [Candidatus Erginobacter occultus]